MVPAVLGLPAQDVLELDAMTLNFSYESPKCNYKPVASTRREKTISLGCSVTVS